MRRRTLLFAVLAMAPCQGGIVDRIAVIVGKRVITDSDIREEIRLSAFWNQTGLDFSPAARRKTAERLVERVLVHNEMEMGNYPPPQPAEIEPELAAFKTGRFPTENSYRQALAQYGVTDEEVKSYLLEQLAALRFIDARFGPMVEILDSEISDYYNEHIVKEWDNRGGKNLPPLDDLRQDIEEILRRERVNHYLDEWLKEAKGRTRIEFKPEAFQ